MDFVPKAKRRKKRKKKKKERSDAPPKDAPMASASATPYAAASAFPESVTTTRPALDRPMPRREKRFTIRAAPKIDRSRGKRGDLLSAGRKDSRKSRRKAADSDDIMTDAKRREFVIRDADLVAIHTTELSDTEFAADELKASGDLLGPVTLGANASVSRVADDSSADATVAGIGTADFGQKPADALRSAKPSEVFLFELPNHLPLRKVAGTSGVAESSSSGLKQFGSGRIGKLRLRKSGKLEMVIGSHVYELSNDSVNDARQEVMSIKVEHAADGSGLVGHCRPLGLLHPNRHFVCSAHVSSFL